MVESLKKLIILFKSATGAAQVGIGSTQTRPKLYQGKLNQPDRNEPGSYNTKTCSGF